jgi:SPP1 family predicted phage head-tail adaptor
MNIGGKNKRVDIEAPTLTPDGMGGHTVSFTTIASSVAASIWPVSANEIIASNAPAMVTTHRIRMRFRKDIKSNWRLRYHNTYFNITAIIDINMANRELEILCKAV